MCPTSALTMFARARLQVQREQRDGRVVGHAHGAAAQRDRVVGHEREQVVFDAAAGARVCPVRGGPSGTARARRRPAPHEHERRRRHPPAPSADRRAAGASSRTRRRRRRCTGSPRRGTRSACRSAGRSRRTRRTRAPPARRRPRPRARAGAATAARARRRAQRATSTGGRRISPIRRGMYSGTFAIPVTRPSV